VVGESVVRVHELARSVYASTGSGVTSKSFMLILVWVGGTDRSLGWFQCGSAPISRSRLKDVMWRSGSP
jgi:hypothetical protein